MDNIRLIELKYALQKAADAVDYATSIKNSNDLATKHGGKSDQKLAIEAKRHLDKCMVDIADKYKAL